MANSHVNLVDLTTPREAGLKLFESVKALSKYTIRTGKIFPREDAYAGTLLRHLLRHIFCPEKDGDRLRSRTRFRREEMGHGKSFRGDSTQLAFAFSTCCRSLYAFTFSRTS